MLPAWTTFTPGKQIVITRKWYLNGRLYVDGGHEAVYVEVSTGNPEQVIIPDDCYSFRIVSLAETEVELEYVSGQPEILVLRSQPLSQSPVYFVKERVQVMGVQELRSSFTAVEIDPLLDQMDILQTTICLVLPGKVFMPITDEVNFLSLEKEKAGL